MKKSGVYYPELDSLRFFAFLMVLVHHTPYPKSIALWETLSNYGWIGVDLFLCLSAFLFARLLFVEYQERGNINIGYFYLRRALRIWPLYFLFYAVMLILSVHEKGWTPYLIKRSIGMLTFTDNIFSAAVGYNAAILFSNHIWTISYEEQFYLVIPWVLRKFYQLKRSTTVIVLITILLIGSLIRSIFIYTDIPHPAIWVLPITHFESILGGLVIGLGIFDRITKKSHPWILLLTGVFALYLITILPNINKNRWELMLTYPLIGIGTSLVLLAVMQGNLGLLSPLFKSKTLGYLGKISYGLYVYHLLSIHLASFLTNLVIPEERLFVYPATVLILSFFITVILSAISYQLLESPFLRLKEKFAFIRTRPV